jgi:hypothetical protein
LTKDKTKTTPRHPQCTLAIPDAWLSILQAIPKKVSNIAAAILGKFFASSKVRLLTELFFAADDRAE